jgi:vitamin K-dependent gamma-carboxylase-like protein
VRIEPWIKVWNAYWFPTTASRALYISRIVAVAAQLFWFFPHLDYNLNLLVKNTVFMDPQPLIRAISAVVPRAVFFTPTVLTTIYWVTIIAGVAALVGLLTRVSIFVFALGIWFFVSHQYSYADIHHPEAVFCIVLMALALAPSGRRLSLDAVIRRRRASAAGRVTDISQADDRAETTMWPLKLAHVLLAMTYFSTGATKLISGGLGWMNGYTLQGYTFGDAMARGYPVGIWLGQHYTICLLLSIFTIAFESLFFLSLFFPRVAPLFFLNGIFFQIGLFATGGHPFFQHITLLTLLLFFITPAWWQTLSERYRNRLTPSRPGAPERRVPTEPSLAG